MTSASTERKYESQDAGVFYSGHDYMQRMANYMDGLSALGAVQKWRLSLEMAL